MSSSNRHSDTEHDAKVDTWTVAQIWPRSQRHQDPCLVQIYPTGPGMALRYTLGQAPIVIGRAQECQLGIPHDTSVSRRHARVQRLADGYLVADLNSTNGTYVNNVRVSEPVSLEDGDYLRVGKCIFRFLASGNVEAEYHEEIYRMSIIDALTESYNKRYLLEFLSQELFRTFRYGRPLSLIMMDIDHFKDINDRLGHLGGDLILRELAACIKQTCRKETLFARYGGEEFALVLPEATLEDAFLVAERIRILVESHPFQYEGQACGVTISLGVAVVAASEPALTPEALIKKADDRLYQAKRQGRNCVKAESCTLALPAESAAV